jgi:hypothetical protein
MAALVTTSSSALTPEAHLLIQMAANGAAARPLDDRLDWLRLLQLVMQERSVSIVWRWLQHRNGKALARDVARQWQTLSMVGEFQDLQRQRMLVQILDLMAHHRIEVMLLKGSALATSVYEEFGDRPMGDLDVMVRPDQAIDAWSLLQQHGWSWPAASWPAKQYAALQHLPPLVSAGGDTTLEIHTALLPNGHPFDWPIESVWDEARRMAFAGRTTLVPQPLHLLLHVCVHFGWSHEMSSCGWRMLRDVKALTRGAVIDWPAFVQLAQRSRARTCCFWTLMLARNLAGAAIPSDVLVALRPPRPAFLLRRIEGHVLRQLFSVDQTCPSVAVCHALWELAIAPRWSGHGRARPWQGSERWGAAHAPSKRRFLQNARHAIDAMRYVGRIASP